MLPTLDFAPGHSTHGLYYPRTGLLHAESGLFGEFDKLGVAASVQRDQNPEYFAVHRMDLRLPGSDVPRLHQQDLRAVPVAEVEIGAGGVGVDVDHFGRRQPGLSAGQLPARRITSRGRPRSPLAASTWVAVLSGPKRSLWISTSVGNSSAAVQAASMCRWVSARSFNSPAKAMPRRCRAPVAKAFPDRAMPRRRPRWPGPPR